MAKPIPVLNLYYMFCYAWDAFEEGKELASGGVQAETLIDLVADVMGRAVRRLLRRGMDQGYSERVERLSALRGAVDVAGSVPLIARRSPSLSCRFDERSPDVPHNRVVKAAMTRLVATKGLAGPLADGLRALLPRLAGVADVPLRPAAFNTVQLYRHNSAYTFLMHLARLVMEASIPEQEGTRSRFRDIANDEASMRAVFESFIRNLLAREQQTFKVSRPTLRWDTGPGLGSGMLPGMRLDVLLQAPGRNIVIDAKYTLASTHTYYGREALRSGHLYQLFAYLRNAAASLIGHAEGVLVYPADGVAREHADIVQGHPLKIVTLDLARPWPDIRSAVLALAA